MTLMGIDCTQASQYLIACNVCDSLTSDLILELIIQIDKKKSCGPDEIYPETVGDAAL
jgi:hypothetical protein